MATNYSGQLPIAAASLISVLAADPAFCAAVVACGASGVDVFPNALTLVGTTLSIAQANGGPTLSIDLAPIESHVTAATLVGTALTLTVSGQPDVTVDLATLPVIDPARGNVTLSSSPTGLKAEAITSWVAGASYLVNDFVVDSDILYRANIAHAAGATFVADAANWNAVSNTVITATDTDTVTLVVAGSDLTADLRIDTITPGNVTITSTANGVAAAVTFPADLRVVSIAASVTPGVYTATLSDASTFSVDLTALDEAPSAVIPPISSATGAIGTAAAYARADHAHPTTVAYTASGSAITVTVDGVAATLTPAVGTIAQSLGFDAAGALVKQAPTAGIKSWVTATAYAVGDYVEDPLDNRLYRVVTAHTSAALAGIDEAAGRLVRVSRDVYAWQATTAFPDEVFVVGSDGRLYKSTTAFTSAATIEADVIALNLTELSRAYHEYVANNNTYRLGDIVLDTVTNKLYRVLVKFTTTVTSTVAADVIAGNLVEMSPGGASASTPLHWAQLRRNDGAQGNANAWVDGTRVGSGTFPWPVAEGVGAGANTNGTITINQAGRYLIEAQIIDIDGLTNVGATWQIRSNGSPISRFTMEFSGSDPIYNFSTVADLSVGNVIDIFPVATVGVGTKRLLSGSFFRVVQLATESVVDPTLIVPTPLHAVSIATTAPDVNSVATVLTESGVGGYFVPNLADPMLTKYDPNAMIVGNKVVIQQAGRYRLAAGARLVGATPEPGIRVNGIYVATGDHFGSNEFLSYECVRALVVGDIVDFTVNASAVASNANSFYLTVEQLAASTVVDPGLIPAASASGATSGYFDLGNTRVQWGRLVTNVNGTTINLPAPFANANYAVTLQPNAATGAAVLYGDPNTPTQFAAYGYSLANTVIPGTMDVGYIAVGLKP